MLKIPLTWRTIREANKRKERRDMLLMFLYALLGVVFIIIVFASAMLWGVLMEKEVKHDVPKTPFNRSCWERNL